MANSGDLQVLGFSYYFGVGYLGRFVIYSDSQLAPTLSLNLLPTGEYYMTLQSFVCLDLVY